MKNFEIISNSHFNEHLKVLKNTALKSKKKIVEASKIVTECLLSKGTVYWCGNGGSASDSMHLSAELIGRFKKNRMPLRSQSLLLDPAGMTCISNDFGYENIFSRQINGLSKSGDVLIAISTSGKSKNIVNAIKTAKKKSLKVISLLGGTGGYCKNESDLEIIINSKSTARIQEMHIMIGHIICDLVEKRMKL
tara:strand:- start:1558 stop:2136 length:579 start_codon:yes stop_codon:yes gene_type:complete